MQHWELYYVDEQENYLHMRLYQQELALALDMAHTATGNDEGFIVRMNMQRKQEKQDGK